MGVIVQQNRVSRKKPELLGPGGSLSQALWSLEGGADAVYAGWKSYSARSQAENLDLADFSRLLGLAHGNSRKVYGAFNTLLADPEIPRVVEVIWQLWLRGLDGVILQDLGLLSALKHGGPPIDLHASTQLAVQDARGARLARDHGFSRVVLARELTLDEMAVIRAAVPDLELEVFVAGAQCYAASGQCQASLRLLGRSANRGSCAQLCRNRLDLPSPPRGPGSTSGSRPAEKGGTWFSMNDLDLLDRLGDLEKIGIDSLKIEGRMKGPLYARSLCRAWRLALDAPGSSKDSTMVNASLDQAAFAFSREHSRGFAESPRGSADLINHEWAGPTGLALGSIENLEATHVRVRLDRNIAVKDGILLLGQNETHRAAVTSIRAIKTSSGPGKAGKHSGHHQGHGSKVQADSTHARAGQTVDLVLRQDSDPAQARSLQGLAAAWRRGSPVAIRKVSDHGLKLPEFPAWPVSGHEASQARDQGSGGQHQHPDRRPCLRLRVSGGPGEKLCMYTVLEAGRGGPPLLDFDLETPQDCQARTGDRGLDQALEQIFTALPQLEAVLVLECQGSLDQAFLPPSALKELRRQWKDHLLARLSELPGLMAGTLQETTGAGMATGLESGSSASTPASARAPGSPEPMPASAGPPGVPVLRRSSLSPPGHPLPFLGASDLQRRELLRVLELEGNQWQVACLDPLCFQTRSRELDTAFKELLDGADGQKYLLGMNNLAHADLALELAAAWPGRIGVFADWLMNISNPGALEWMHRSLGSLFVAWMPGPEAREDPALFQTVIPGVFRVEWDEGFDPPVFLSRSCFTSRSRGLPCPLDQGKPACTRDRQWRLVQGRQEWQVLVHDCQTYSWLRQLQS